MMDIEKFVAYCVDFYGQKGLYPLHMTPEEATKAARLISLWGDLEGDSVDRERARDIVRIMRGENLTKWEI
jgi:hypothetical protein